MILHGAGILVQVPTPARYAVHKLIISRRRPEGSAKRDKDLRQAETLLLALAEKRPYELNAAWQEAYQRGKTWRELLVEALGALSAHARDVTLKTTNNLRSIIPGLDLNFSNSPARYDFSRDIVAFAGETKGNEVSCAISRAALDDHFGTSGQDQKGRLNVFLENRSTIEEMARTKYLTSPVEEPNAVLLKTTDVAALFDAGRKART